MLCCMLLNVGPPCGDVFFVEAGANVFSSEIETEMHPCEIQPVLSVIYIARRSKTL